MYRIIAVSIRECRMLYSRVPKALYMYKIMRSIPEDRVQYSVALDIYASAFIIKPCKAELGTR